MTVAALADGPVPPRQAFWLCRDPECEVAYFGEDGTTLVVSDLLVEPGFKTKSDQGLLCYCFLVRRSDVEAELRESGECHIIEHITAEVKAGNCACEVRNPSGKCCLGEVQRAVNELRQQPEATR